MGRRGCNRSATRSKAAQLRKRLECCLSYGLQIAGALLCQAAFRNLLGVISRHMAARLLDPCDLFVESHEDTFA